MMLVAPLLGPSRVSASSSQSKWRKALHRTLDERVTLLGP
jgi:hypothetical protein